MRMPARAQQPCANYLLAPAVCQLLTRPRAAQLSPPSPQSPQSPQPLPPQPSLMSMMASRWGEARFGRCDYSEVIELGMNALQLGPGPADREVHALLAEAYKRKGDDEKAREHVRQSLPPPEEVKRMWRARMKGGHETLLVVDGGEPSEGGLVTEEQRPPPRIGAKRRAFLILDADDPPRRMRRRPPSPPPARVPHPDARIPPAPPLRRFPALWDSIVRRFGRYINESSRAFVRMRGLGRAHHPG